MSDLTKHDRANRAQRTAELLLQIQAVEFRPDRPFRLASGKSSPVYMDCRRLISFPAARREINKFLADLIINDIHGSPAIDCIAGGETAGIPFAAFIADRLDKPMAYIRKQPKGYGRNAQIEGVIAPGSHVLLIEDLATDGGSKLKFARAIEKAGGHCRHTAVIVAYGIFPKKEQELAAAGLTLHRLCELHHIVDEATSQGLLNSHESRIMNGFIDNPQEWQQQHPIDKEN